MNRSSCLARACLKENSENPSSGGGVLRRAKLASARYGRIMDPESGLAQSAQGEQLHERMPDEIVYEPGVTNPTYGRSFQSRRLQEQEGFDGVDAVRSTRSVGVVDDDLSPLGELREVNSFDSVESDDFRVRLDEE